MPFILWALTAHLLTEPSFVFGRAVQNCLCLSCPDSICGCYSSDNLGSVAVLQELLPVCLSHSRMQSHVRMFLPVVYSKDDYECKMWVCGICINQIETLMFVCICTFHWICNWPKCFSCWQSQSVWLTVWHILLESPSLVVTLAESGKFIRNVV